MFSFIKKNEIDIKCYYDINTTSLDEFILKVYNDKNELFIFCKNKKMFVTGEKSLINEAVKVIIESNISLFELEKNDLSKLFLDEYIKIMGGNYTLINEKYTYTEGNVKRLLLAGGCFWCASIPYYSIDGVKKIISGYAGGKEVMPTYEEVKKQKTSHRETLLIIYDSAITDFKVLIDSFLSSIDPFDGDGQFIDRGNSYTTAVYTDNVEIIDYTKNKFKELERNFKKEIKVKILPNDILYKAEEFHQDFPILHKKELEEELIVSGRKK